MIVLFDPIFLVKKKGQQQQGHHPKLVGNEALEACLGAREKERSKDMSLSSNEWS